MVLSAGGPAAIAWEIGVIVGLADSGIDVRDVDAVIGTSAGAVVAAQITSGVGLEQLFQQQVDPNLQSKELSPPVDFNQLKAAIAQAKEGTEILRRIGALALATPTVLEPERLAVTASRLPVHTWPSATTQILLLAPTVSSS